MHYQIATVGPRLNEVPRDWGNWFFLWRVRYIENLDFTNLQKNNQNVRYIDGWLTVAVLFYFFFCFVVVVFVLFGVRRRATQNLGIGKIPLNDICVLMST